MRKISINKGFTLIELLVVMAVMGLLSGIAMSLYSNLNQSRNLQKGSDGLAAMLTQARSYSQSQVSLPQCSGTLSGYSVIINPTGSSNCYSLNEACVVPPSTNQRALVCLPSGVKFHTATQTTVFFPIQNGSITSASIIIDGASGYKTVSVNGNGAITSQ